MVTENLTMQYNTPLFRPPSEAQSLILQITLGCSWNKCAFCEMYTSVHFKVRKEEEIIDEINTAAREINWAIRKVFLADGDSMVLSTKKLLNILNAINKAFPKIQRISAYALPKNLSSKSLEELIALREAGLKLVYVGIESGDDELLKLINKGETYNTTVDGLLKAKQAVINSSVMILTGLGGLKYSEQHARNSAKILNKIQPFYASTLVLSFPFGVDRYKERFNGTYIPMTTQDILKEMEIFIENTDLESTIFRSDHASNYIVLKGILSRDKQKFIDNIHYVINKPQLLRKEWQRGL